VFALIGLLFFQLYRGGWDNRGPSAGKFGRCESAGQASIISRAATWDIIAESVRL